MRKVYPITRNPKDLKTGKWLIFHEYKMAVEILDAVFFEEADKSNVKLKEGEYIVGDFLFDYPGK